MFLVSSASGQQASNVKDLRLVSEYKQTRVEDISDDGKLVLYQMSTLMRTFSVPLDGRPPVALPKPSNDSDFLRIVDLSTGQEVARTRVEFYPTRVQFINGTRTVFYIEPAPLPKYAARLWDYDQNAVGTCTNDISVGAINFVSTNRALAIVSKARSPQSLGVLTLPDCKIVDVVPADPQHPERGVLYPLTISSHGHLLYKTTGHEILVRDIKTMTILHRFPRLQNGLYVGSHNAAFTPDGKQLLLVGSNTVDDTAKTERYLLFYDTETYDLVRKETVTAWRQPIVRNDTTINSDVLGSAWAISPDGETIAIANTTNDERIAFVDLYELKTLKKIARAAFPAVRVSRDNPFAARISQLFFTPDGKHLIASTDTTRVWRVN